MSSPHAASNAEQSESEVASQSQEHHIQPSELENHRKSEPVAPLTEPEKSTQDAADQMTTAGGAVVTAETPVQQLNAAPKTELTIRTKLDGGHEPRQVALADPVDSSKGPSLTAEHPAGTIPTKPNHDGRAPPPPPKDDKYTESYDPQNKGSSGGDPEKDALGIEDMGYVEDYPQADDDSRSEIQSIMEQFHEGMGGPGMEEIMSPRLEKAGPLLGSPIQHPPRKSSLEPLLPGTLPSPGEGEALKTSGVLQTPPMRTSSLVSVTSAASLRSQAVASNPPESPVLAQTPRPLPQPPQPDPESDLPFDFHRFLEQLRHRTADPVAKFLRSFLLEFGKKQWMVHEQVKIISDFLEFITKKMAQCEVWRTVSDAEFDNAREGMEKLVMNRLYTQTFSPAIAPPEPATLPKGKRKAAQPSVNASKSGRKGQHQEDVERDEVLAQKVRIYGWVKEEHLDIKPISEKGRKFLTLAQQGLYWTKPCHE